MISNKFVREQRFLGSAAKYQVGDVLWFRCGGYHIAEGAQVSVAAVRLDHTHVPDHNESCFQSDRIEYEVTVSDSSGNVALRFKARERELQRRYDWLIVR